MSYIAKLETRIAEIQSNLCVGLDVRAGSAEEARDFILQVVEETAPYTAAYKPNAAYFEALGWKGVRLLEELRDLIPAGIPIVLDVKRGDIGETQRYYAKACFDAVRADAVTLNPFMGRDTLDPFLEYSDKGFYLLCVTSNPGAADIELQKVGEKHVFEIVANMLKGANEGGLVVGLTNASADTLSLIPDVPLLIPGLGAQGGDLENLKHQARKAPPLINVSRGILYAEAEKTFAAKAAFWQAQIQTGLA